MDHAHLINTPLQWGETGMTKPRNRFSGFPAAGETAKTVNYPGRTLTTPQKRGVNENGADQTEQG